MPDWQPRNTSRARELRNQATPAERLLWQHIGASRLGAKFSRQMPLGPYFCDFLCRQEKLVIELDGESHTDEDIDARRDRYMIGQGYRVLRFTNAELLGNVEGVVTAIIAALAGRPTPNPSRKR